jgi:pilus assembly protein FimV
LALLGGFFWYRRRKEQPSAAHVDSSFLESRLQPDSFFGASGGQHVDTAQDGATPSTSQGYTNSQLGSPDDVDPVAEADVYLAYGRDMQAEEILKEALRHNPQRFAIHSKLLDIYAKRRDAASFLSAANTAFKLVGGESPEWGRICELGLTIDPQNTLYQPGGATASAFVSLEQNALTSPPTGGVESDNAVANLPLGNTDLDLDLDFSAEDAQASAIPEAPSASLEEPSVDATLKLDAQEPAESNGIDFDIPELDAPTSVAAASAPTELPQEITDLSLDFDDLNLDPPAPPEHEPAPALPDLSAAMPELPEPMTKAIAEPAKSSDGMLEFDLGSLSLDLGPSAQDGTEVADPVAGDSSLETKLALAEEFVSIGDQDGARALIEEVVAEATGELREKAQRALANLS